MPLISIVIPAYNPGPHFDECLESIASQTFRDFEVVVIDDGSMTPIEDSVANGRSIPKDLIKIVRTANNGPYAARCRGIAEAKGTYVMNMDADDEFIGVDALAQVAVTLETKTPDLLLINASAQKNGAVPLADYSVLKPDGLSHGPVSVDPEAFKALFANDYIYNSVWTKVVRREIVGGLQPPYPRIIMAEDRMLDMDFLPGAQSLALLDEPLYYYRPSETSITHAGYRPEYYLQVCEVESRVLAWLDDTGFDERAWAANFLRVTCNALLGLAYNRALDAAELNDVFEEVRVQGPYRRAFAADVLSLLSRYERAQLSLLESRRFKPLFLMMRARGFVSLMRIASRRDVMGDER